MDDLDLDHELQAALDVSPSPAFVARVRRSIAECPEMQIVPGWLAPMVAAACIALAVFLVGPDQAVDAPAQVANAAATAPLTPLPDPSGEVQQTRLEPPPRGQVARRNARVVTSVASSATTVPEVLVADADKRAFDTFVRMLQERRFAATFEDAPVSTPWVVTELTVPPITIAPLEGMPEAADVPAVHN